MWVGHGAKIFTFDSCKDINGIVQDASFLEVVDSACAAADEGREVLDTVDKLCLWFLPCRKRNLGERKFC